MNKVISNNLAATLGQKKNNNKNKQKRINAKLI